MSSKSSTTSGLPSAWEGEALAILRHHERRFAHRLPEAELRSRVLQKLARAKVSSPSHLGVLISKIVHQVVADHSKQQSRHYRRYVHDYNFDRLLENPGLCPHVKERLADLLDEDSPLDESEKALVRLMLEEPDIFMRDDGHPEQSAVARHLKIRAHTTIGRRWIQMMEKVAAWKPGRPDISI